MLKTPYLLFFSFTILLNFPVSAQPKKFTPDSIMNKVKEFIPGYSFHHYKWPLPPDASYGGEVLGPDEIDVSVEFKNGSPYTLFIKNMDIINNAMHVSIINEILKIVDERYSGWFTKFCTSSTSKKSLKYNAYEEKNDEARTLRFKYDAKTKKFSCHLFF